MTPVNINNAEKGYAREMMGSHQSKTFSLLPLFVILIVSFAVYFNALFNEFVYDDLPSIIDNPWIKDIKYLPKIFSSQLAGFNAGYATSYYRPLIHVIYMLDYAVFGLNPWGFHLVNILFHTGASILLFFITSKLLSGPPLFPSARMLSPALLVALLFATHPIHTEAVTWIAGIMDVSCAFFLLLSLFLYMRSETGGKYNYYLSIAFFFLSTLCKEPALTLPFILIAYDYVYEKIDFHLPRHFLRYLPYIVVMGIYFALRLNALGAFAPSKTNINLNAYQYVINIVPLFAQYLVKLILPFNLSLIYIFHPLTSFFELREIVSLVFVLGIIFLAYRARKDKAIFFSLFLMILPLLPAFYIKSIAGESVFAERYLYLPSAGFAIIVGLLISRIRLSVSYQNTVLAIVFFMLIVSFSAGTLLRNRVWKNSYTLWTDTVKKNPDSAVAHKYLGFALYANGKLDDAIDQYKTALDLKFTDKETHLNLGAAYDLKGWTEQAIVHYQAVIMLDPAYSSAYTNLGGAYLKTGLIDKAIEHFQIAIKLRPDEAAAYSGLGIAYARRGLIDEAIKSFGTALRLDPDNRDYYDHLMKAYELRKLSK